MKLPRLGHYSPYQGNNENGWDDKANEDLPDAEHQPIFDIDLVELEGFRYKPAEEDRRQCATDQQQVVRSNCVERVEQVLSLIGRDEVQQTDF